MMATAYLDTNQDYILQAEEWINGKGNPSYCCHKSLKRVYLRPVYQHREDLIPAYSLTYPDFDLLHPFLSEAFPCFPGGRTFLLTMGDGNLVSLERSQGQSCWMTWWRGRKKGVVDVCMYEQSLIVLCHTSDHSAEEATGVPIPEPIDTDPGIEDVELPEEAESELDEDDSSKEEGDGSESEHQVFGTFCSDCSDCFLELPEWSVHMHTGVFGIGGRHPSQWIVGVQWKQWSASMWCLGASGEMLKRWKLKLTAEPKNPELSLLEPEELKTMLPEQEQLEWCLSELEQPKQKIPKTWWRGSDNSDYVDYWVAQCITMYCNCLQWFITNYNCLSPLQWLT